MPDDVRQVLDSSLALVRHLLDACHCVGIDPGPLGVAVEFECSAFVPSLLSYNLG